MKKILQKKALFLTLFIFCLLAGVLFSQTAERYFDTEGLTSKEVRLAILYPSIGSIRALEELRNQGFITLDDLIIIGVYHEKERTNYKSSISYVKRKKLDWFKFHKLSGVLTKDNLFQKNPCTADFEQIFKKSDGVIFFGGADIPPYIYKKKTSLLTRISTPYRHFLELSFAFHLLGGAQDKNFKALLESHLQFPVLGICLGCQTLNIGTGGTLIQDIPFEKYRKKFLEEVIALGKENWHTNPFARLYPEERLTSINMHPIKLEKNSKFCKEFGFNENDAPYILSAHHQMVDKPGKGIKIAATSLDGKVIEAIEHEIYPNVLGVQFHPEFPSLWDTDQKFRFTPEDNEGQSLLSILEGNPPSFDFHKKIWAWLSQKLKEYHTSK